MELALPITDVLDLGSILSARGFAQTRLALSAFDFTQAATALLTKSHAHPEFVTAMFDSVQPEALVSSQGSARPNILISVSDCDNSRPTFFSQNFAHPGCATLTSGIARLTSLVLVLELLNLRPTVPLQALTCSSSSSIILGFTNVGLVLVSRLFACSRLLSLLCGVSALSTSLFVPDPFNLSSALLSRSYT